MKQEQPQAGFNLSKWALEHGPLTRYLMVVLMLLGVAAFWAAAAEWFWRVSVRRYTSASS